MRKRRPYRNVISQPQAGSSSEAHWVEIFAARVGEDLKRVLQEDLDWTTSLPILERLNRLHDVEEKRNALQDAEPLFRKAS